MIPVWYFASLGAIMYSYRLLFSAMLLASAGFNASADSLTAEFQTRLKLLGENPGKVDGAFGGKTNTAANNYFKTGNQNY